MNKAISDCTGGETRSINNPLLPYKTRIGKGVDGKRKGIER